MRIQEFDALTADEMQIFVDRSMGKPNGQLGSLQAKLGVLESRYEMSTDTMLSRFRSGQLRETAEIARWLVLAQARGE